MFYKFINHNFSISLPSRCGSNWMIHNWPGNFAFQASKSMSGFVMGTSASSSWPCKHPAVCCGQVGLKPHPDFFVKMSVSQEISKKRNSGAPLQSEWFHHPVRGATSAIQHPTGQVKSSSLLDLVRLFRIDVVSTFIKIHPALNHFS